MSAENIQPESEPQRPMSPVMEVWSVAWPTVLTMTSYTVMTFVDGLMVAQVGPQEVAAQGNGGIWSFAPIAFAFGMLSVVNTFVAQNLGAGRPERGPKYAWASIWLAFALWLLLLLPYAVALPAIFGAMNHSPELTAMETMYGRILLVGGIFVMLAKGMHHYFFGLHRPKVVFVSALLGFAVNLIGNYVLIFGSGGLLITGADGAVVLDVPGIPGTPALGLLGAAIGTVLGTFVEIAIPFAIFMGPKMNRELRSRSAWRPQWKPMRDLLRIGWPASIQFGNELVCWALFMSVLVGKFGEDHITASWAALRYMHLSFMPAVGFSVATTSLVGKYIGAGQPDVAAARCRLALKISILYMTVCAVVFFVFRRELISLFVGGTDLDPARAAEIIEIGAKLMICAAVFQTIDAFGIVYTGGLRGGGDTVWPGIMTIIYGWLFIVGVGWLFAEFWPSIESVGPWIGASIYVILYGITMAWRFESGRWRSIQLLESEPASQECDSSPATTRAPDTSDG